MILHLPPSKMTDYIKFRGANRPVNQTRYTPVLTSGQSNGHIERLARVQRRREIQRQREMGGNISRGSRNPRRGASTKRTPPPGGAPMPPRLAVLLDMPPANKDLQDKHAWSQLDRSANIFVQENDSRTFHRHPVAQSTDCIRTMAGYEEGLHVFEMTWPCRQRGTHAVVGVATHDAPLHAQGYVSLVGNNVHSWGVDLVHNKLLHDSRAGAIRDDTLYPEWLSIDDTYVIPDKFILVLDMDAGTLGLVVEGQYLGVAHTGLRGKKLFPIVSTVWGHCEISIKYMGGLESGPVPLMDLCRHAIRRQVGRKQIDAGSMERLNLPKPIKLFLNYKDKICD